MERDQNPTVTPSGARPGTLIVVLLCILLIFNTVAYGGVDPGSLAISSIITGGILLIWISRLVTGREIDLNADVLLLPLVVWIVLGVIQLLPILNAESGDVAIPQSRVISLDPFATRIFIMRLVVYVLFFAAALTFINSSKRKRSVAFFIVGFGSLMAFFGILQWLTKPAGIYGLRPTPQAIPFASFVNQHHFAALMEMTIGVGLGLLFGLKTRMDRALLIGFALLLMAAAIVLTGSRGGVLGLFAVIGFFILYWRAIGYGGTAEAPVMSRHIQSRLAVVAAAVFGIVILVGMVLFLGGTDSLLRGFGLHGGESDFTSGRSHFWKIAWQIFLSHPIIGAGFDSFGVAYTRLDTMNGLFRVEQAHNDYLQTLADGGIAAFVAALAFIFFLFGKGIRVIAKTYDRLDKSIAVGAMAGCAGILTHSFFDFPIRTPANAYFFLTLVVLTVNGVVHNSTDRKRSS
jgi:O-antigen ligase